MKIIRTLIALIVVFMVGATVGSIYASKTIYLYAPTPGQYVIDPYGGNTIVAFGPVGSSAMCDYLEDYEEWDRRLVAIAREKNVTPACFTTHQGLPS